MTPAAGRSRHQRFGPAKGIAGALTTASLLVPAELMLRPLAPGRQTALPWLFHRALARSLGIRIVSHGGPVRRKRVLFVANHLSWSDIPVLGARLRGAAFIAKSEVGGWGMVGKLADMGRTVYVERGRRLDAATQRDSISGRLARGDSLILFPEGTNSDGVAVLPFKSSLFAVADGVEDLLIQPVTIAYTRVNGLPVTRRSLPELAWVGDTELMPHAMDFMGLGAVRAELLFHEAVCAGDFDGRKALARHCETVVTQGYRRRMRAQSS
ncbi:1-acyl-sn-glycerol-3-phosphate acyltransferase [Polymorphobacter multimanifer]|uniref:lysophospholipid acyltransferase family protein n=1 Tax=Polymorphobacter multimanifer TaxID=1070431 RepID=UPI00166C442C|nr:lysophospholipid acyltransferase family protein [Polymorphobacter multimanifer]GGI82915.1 1-acyl-sn-glycerol-3-phosphate acyltransferase [Polymorphobacter multimanifer]